MRLGLVHALAGVLTVLLCCPATAQQSSDNPLEYYGGSLLALAGRDAVVLAVDQRAGKGLGLIVPDSQRPVLWLPGTDGNDGRRRPPRWLLTATGLPGDVQSLQADVRALLQTTKVPLSLETEKDDTLSAATAVALTSYLLYHRRGAYLVQPLLVGFDDGDIPGEAQQAARPMVCSFDGIGATSVFGNYAAAGAAAASLLGTAAAHWRPDLSATELVTLAAHVLQATDRNILSGYGAVLYVLHANGKLETFEVQARND
jgi:20S proteasome subunit beta 3